MSRDRDKLLEKVSKESSLSKKMGAYFSCKGETNLEVQKFKLLLSAERIFVPSERLCWFGEGKFMIKNLKIRYKVPGEDLPTWYKDYKTNRHNLEEVQGCYEFLSKVCIPARMRGKLDEDIVFYSRRQGPLLRPKMAVMLKNKTPWLWVLVTKMVEPPKLKNFVEEKNIIYGHAGIIFAPNMHISKDRREHALLRNIIIIDGSDVAGVDKELSSRERKKFWEERGFNRILENLKLEDEESTEVVMSEGSLNRKMKKYFECEGDLVIKYSKDDAKIGVVGDDVYVPPCRVFMSKGRFFDPRLLEITSSTTVERVPEWYVHYKKLMNIDEYREAREKVYRFLITVSDGLVGKPNEDVMLYMNLGKPIQRVDMMVKLSRKSFWLWVDVCKAREIDVNHLFRTKRKMLGRPGIIFFPNMRIGLQLKADAIIRNVMLVDMDEMKEFDGKAPTFRDRMRFWNTLGLRNIDLYLTRSS